MLTSLFIFFQFIISYVSAHFIKNKMINVFGFIFCFLLYLSVFGGITYTTDWFGYEYLFKNDEILIDITFRILSNQTKLLGLDYIHLFQFHVFITGLFLLFFISRFTNNMFFVVSFIILILFIPLANQIRFFLSLVIFLNSIYFLCLKNNKLFFYFLGFFSIITHIGILPFFLFVPAYYIKKEITFNMYLLTLAILSFIVIYFFFATGSIISEFRFNPYIEESYSTSFFGALFQALPPILFFIILFFKKKIFINKIINQGDKKINFLYKLILFSFVFIPASFLTQIILFRYCISVFFVGILLILCNSSYYKLKSRLFNISYLFIFQWLYVIYIYLFPMLILGSDENLSKAILILQSIDFNF